MALYKGDKRCTIGYNNSGNTTQPLTVTKDGVYTLPSGVDGFSPVTMKANNIFNNMGSHVDSNGIWHRPEEWDDIESIDLTNKHEVYFLCACHLTGTDFFRIRFYGGGTLSWSYGHVSNGTYTLHANSTETTVSSGDYISLYLSDIVDDYIVVRIKATSYITSCTYQNWVADANINYAAPFRCQSVLMRYGRMIRCNSIANSATYCLESDNIIDMAKYYQGGTTTITMNGAYENAFNLQRWRCTGWDLSKNKVTTFATMFSNCWCLCDVPDPLDLSGWVRSYTTTTANMFNNCYSMNTHILVNNWDLTNITTMASTFLQCRAVKSIEGTETWNSAPKCTNTSNLFYSCQSNTSALDVSKCYFGNGTSNLTTTANMFGGNYCCPSINISNMNLSKCTTITYMFNSTMACKEIIMNNVTPISQTCTISSYFFGYSGIKELILDGWDFSKNTTSFLSLSFYYSMGLKKLIFRNCTAPSGVTINDSSNGCVYCRYAYNLEYLDVSFLDMSVFSNTKTHTDSFRDMHNLVDFYPPRNISKSFSLANDLKLSHDSLVRVITNLVTLGSGETATLTIGAYNISKLSAAEQAVATGKGWTLA